MTRLNPFIEQECEMVRLSGTTPDEIAADFARVINERYQNPKQIFSKFLGEMANMVVASNCIREIAGTYYAEIDWCIAFNKDSAEDEN